MSFFNRFPLLAYDVANNDNYKLLPDILRRVKMRTSLRSSKWFGDAELHWVILMTNNVLDRYHDWPMNQVQFQAFLEDKYSNPDGIHHYEITKDSGTLTPQGPTDYSHKVEVNSDTVNAVSIQR